MVRTPSIDEKGMKKGSWTEDEDRRLRAYIERYGHWNWRQLPKFAGLQRCGKSCRLRWMNHLRPGLKRGNYTKEEDDLIIELHEKLGNKWSAIAAKLPGRSDNEIKNYWHTHLKTRLKQIPLTEVNVGLRIEASQSEASQQSQQPEISRMEIAKEASSTAEISKNLEVEPPALMVSSSESSSSSSSSSNSNWLLQEDGISLFQTFLEEPLETFWRLPFLPETSYSYQNYFPSSFDGDGDGDFASYTSYLDDGNDFSYQVMGGDPKNNYN